MKGPLVSVIIPTYNRLEYIQVAIDSVLRQTYQNREIIIVDDGSVDGTRDVIPEKYAGKVNYHFQENRGRSAARNFGASLASGNYLAFLDSDDMWVPSKLERQIAEFSKSDVSDIAAVCSSAYFIDNFGDFIHKKPIGRQPKLYQYEVERFFISPLIVAPPSNMLMRRDCFYDVGGFDEEMSYGEDWDLIIRLRKQWHFLYIDEPLLYFRFGSKFTNRLPYQEQIPAMIDDMFRLYRKIDSIVVTNKDPYFFEKSVSNIYETAAYWYFARKAYTAGKSHLLKSGKLHQAYLGTIINNLSYWGAYGAMESRGNDSTQCEMDFNLDFTPNVIDALAKEVTISRRDYTNLASGFYHNLAWHLFPKVNGRPIQALCLKAIGLNFFYFFSKQTLKMLIVSTYFACKRSLEYGTITRKKRA